MRGKSIPKSVLKSGVKLPELSKSKSQSIPTDLNKAGFVVSSRGPTPQEELEACRPLLNLSDNMFIRKDRRKPSPVTKRRIEVEIICKEKKFDNVCESNKMKDDCTSLSSDQREKVRQELSAVLKRSTDSTVSPKLLLQDPNPTSMRRIVSFSGTVQMEEREDSGEDQPSVNVDGHTRKSDNIKVNITTIDNRNTGQNEKKGDTTDSEEDGDVCQRCGSLVYPLEKLEPGPGQFYHERCFRCAVCKTKLSLVTYCKNLQTTQDPRVYCRPHQPRLDKAFSMDTSAMAIATALKNTKEMKLQPHSLQPAGKIARCEAFGLRYF